MIIDFTSSTADHVTTIKRTGCGLCGELQIPRYSH